MWRTINVRSIFESYVQLQWGRNRYNCSNIVIIRFQCLQMRQLSRGWGNRIDTNRKTLRAAGGCPSGHLIVAHSEQFITSFPSSGLKIAIFLLTRPASRKLSRVPSILDPSSTSSTRRGIEWSVELCNQTTETRYHFFSLLLFNLNE